MFKKHFFLIDQEPHLDFHVCASCCYTKTPAGVCSKYCTDKTANFKYLQLACKYCQIHVTSFLICLYQFSALGPQRQKMLLLVLSKSFPVTTVLNDFQYLAYCPHTRFYFKNIITVWFQEYCLWIVFAVLITSSFWVCSV